jgi:hypothetical protein
MAVKLHWARRRSSASRPAPFAAAVVVVALATGCGGALPADGTASGTPAAVAQVRLFDPFGREVTVHTALLDDESLLLEARLYAADGHRLTEIVGGVDFALQFVPESLATSAPVPREPLRRLVTPMAAAGTSGTQLVMLHFPQDGSSKSFGPFHVLVERGGGFSTEMRLFDSSNAELTQHVPLVAGDTTAIEVRLYDSTGARRTDIPGGAQITFRFDPDSLAHAQPIPGQPFWQAVTPTSPVGTEGSLFVSILFAADSSTHTYGPIQVLVH